MPKYGRPGAASDYDIVLDPACPVQSNVPMLMHGLLILTAYLLGSMASAVLVCRALGLTDPRTQGSGNPGATNVLRLHGQRAALLTLAGDVLKGLLPVLLAQRLQVPAAVVAATAIAAFIGHLYPLYFRFQGGKGVATLIGVLFGTSWQLGLAFLGTWLLVAAMFRYSSLAAISAAVLTPVYAWLLLPANAFVIAYSGLAAVLIWRHRSNIRQLLNGSEDKIGAP